MPMNEEQKAICPEFDYEDCLDDETLAKVQGGGKLGRKILAKLVNKWAEGGGGGGGGG